MLLSTALVLASTLALPAAAGALPADSETGARVSIVDGALRVEAAERGPRRLAIEDGQLVLAPAEVDAGAADPGETAAPAPRVQPLELVRVAVERGAPLFNAGQPEACAAIYDVTVRGLLALDDSVVAAPLRSSLGAALAEAAALRDPVDAAWRLRRGLDEAALAFVDDQPAPAPRPRNTERLLFDLGDGADWPAVNDDVMGGISKGSLRVTDRGTAVFAGRLSLENNGGFSTVRSRGRDLDLGGWDGLVLRVRGDGRAYNLSAMKDASRRNVHMWQATFETEEDTWIEVRVPFEAMQHRVMGWRLDDPVDPAAIRALAFGISDKDTRPFALEIDWIRAWRAN